MGGKGPAEVQVEGQVLHIYVQLVITQAHSGLNTLLIIIIIMTSSIHKVVFKNAKGDEI